MNVILALLFNAMENIALTICVTYAAIRLDKWPILWFLVLVLLNGVSTRTYSGKEKPEDEKEQL